MAGKVGAVQPPVLVVVTGPPASGKTTLARDLATGLRVTVLSKDTFKETLYEVFGSGEELEAVIERAGLALLSAAAAQQLESSLPVIVESDFDRAGDEDLLRRLVVDHGARLLQVYCDTPDDEVVDRFRRRASSGERHPGHGDQPQDAAEIERQLREGRWEPLELDAPLLRTRAGDTADALEWVRRSAS